MIRSGYALNNILSVNRMVLHRDGLTLSYPF